MTMRRVIESKWFLLAPTVRRMIVNMVNGAQLKSEMVTGQKLLSEWATLIRSGVGLGNSFFE